jgi:hypothetical protein
MKAYDLKDVAKIKNRFKKSGVALIVIGCFIMLIAMIDFFASDSSNILYLTYVGGLILLLGLMMLLFGYIKKAYKYQISDDEVVAHDSIKSDILNKSKDSTGAFFEHLKNTPLPSKTCPQCGKEMFPDAMYCDNCGCAMFKKCPECKELNQVSSKFCNHCGIQFRT